MSEPNEALWQAQERYRTLLEHAPAGVVLFDHRLHVTECNALFTQLAFGEFAEQMQSSNLVGLDLNTLQDRSLAPALAQTLLGEPGFYEGPYGTNKSRLVYITARLSPLRDASGAVVGGLGMVVNVTERILREQALRTSERRLSQHVRRSPLAVIGWNRNFEVVEWNGSAARIFGHSAEQAMGRHAVGLIVPEAARAHVATVWAKLLNQRGGERSTNENITRDGRTILCDWYNTPLLDDSGVVIGVASQVEDITARTVTVEALRRSEVRFRRLIESAPDAIFVTRGGRFVYANLAFVAAFGFQNIEQVLAIQHHELLTLEDVASPSMRSQRLADAMDAALTNVTDDRPLAVREIRVKLPLGLARVFEIALMWVDYDGLPSLLGFARDVTERQDMQLRLLQADRMVSIGTLAAGVAHEINNPLAYVMGNLDLVSSRRLPELRRELAQIHELFGNTNRQEWPTIELAKTLEKLTSQVAQITEMVDVAREGSGRVRDIVRDLKTFSRPNDEGRGPVDVRRILDASIAMAWNQIRHVAQFEKHYESDVPMVDANESRLGQVFLNLLLNAAQSLVGQPNMDEGNAPTREHLIQVHVGLQGEEVVITVQDTGQGMAKDVIARIFDPFFTTKPVGEGTGLGLWICQGIVHSFDGAISVVSKPNEGSTFRVSFPQTRTTRVEESLRNSDPRIIRRARVLVIDDEPDMGRGIARSLEEHEVVIVTSGRDALTLLATEDRLFDLILCDLMMPGFNGMDLFEVLKTRHPRVVSRIVFMTGGAFTMRAREFLAGGVEQLEKPFHSRDLRLLLQKKLLVV